MTEQQKMQIRAGLSKAMFPNAQVEPSQSGNGVDIRIYDKPNETRTWYNFDPLTSAEDSRALLEWLAADDDRWNKFDLEMFSRQPSRQIAETLDDVLYNRTDAPHVSAAYLIRKWFMTVPLLLIAEAACKALGITEK